jgi:hypothetical protein
MIKLKTIFQIFFCAVCAFAAQKSLAQEYVAPINYNPHVQPHVGKPLRTAKTTVLSLPFFEDFTNYNVIPDTSKWEDREVYINNTMCYQPISRGVATFDGLSQYGVPYDTMSATTLRYADSLTSKPIDLSLNAPADSIYLSFFYQPQGNGFVPDTQDSLMLFFRIKGSAGNWVQVWADSGSALKPFTQVTIPVADTNFFHSSFQFRFVNKVAIGPSDNVWNVDYIRMATGRNINDTLVNDVAFTQTPTFLLNDYDYMPYRQYLASPAAERATTLQSNVHNNYNSLQNIAGFGYTAQELVSSSALSSATAASSSIAASGDLPINFPSYTATVPIVGTYDKVVFQNKFYLQSLGASDNRINDTIVCNQVFDNYLAYDDGTAEMSYFLNLFPTLAGKIAIEHHLNQPDTLRGMAIYFGRQVPLATYKYFSIVVYRSIAYAGGKDSVLYQMDNLIPGYADTVNNFWVYKFDKPVPLPAGTFYIGTIQPALSGSDSLYIGLDRNRVGGNHAYYSVLNVWQSSLVSGALMMRPLLGQPIIGTSLKEIGLPQSSFELYPNPASESIQLQLAQNDRTAQYEICDLQGRILQTQQMETGTTKIDITALPVGIYMVKILSGEWHYSVQKFIKQ